MKTPIQFACALALGAISASAFAAVRYECHAVETGSYGWSMALAINSAGEMVGFGEFPSGDRNAARWSSSGAVTELGDLGEYGGANDINDNGLVVGYSRTPGFATYLPVRWDGTTAVALPLREGDTVGYAYEVNNRGVIVGISGLKANGLAHAVMWRNGRVIDLGALGDKTQQKSRNSSANGINRDGVVVGSSQTGEPNATHAVWWDTNRQIHDLGALPGALAASAQAINDKGVIVGYSKSSGSADAPEHAVAWVDGVPRDLGVQAGRTMSHAYAINRAGTVVGTGDDDVGTVRQAALVWPSLNRAPRDLNTLLTNRCQTGGGVYHLNYATGINGDGAISVTGEYIDGLGGVHYGAFKLVPVTNAAD